MCYIQHIQYRCGHWTDAIETSCPRSYTVKAIYDPSIEFLRPCAERSSLGSVGSNILCPACKKFEDRQPIKREWKRRETMWNPNYYEKKAEVKVSTPTVVFEEVVWHIEEDSSTNSDIHISPPQKLQDPSHLETSTKPIPTKKDRIDSVISTHSPSSSMDIHHESPTSLNEDQISNSTTLIGSDSGLTSKENLLESTPSTCNLHKLTPTKPEHLISSDETPQQERRRSVLGRLVELRILDRFLKDRRWRSADLLDMGVGGEA